MAELTQATTARVDLDAFNDAMAMDTPELVTALTELLGLKLVAYLGKVQETRAVRMWAAGTRKIANSNDVERLRLAYRAARVISEKDSRTVAQSWFQGLNPYLDDRSPARVLRDGDVESDGSRVIGAARQFVAVG